MKLEDTIYKRKSCRKYTKEKLNNKEISEIKNFISTIKPLYPNIKTDFKIISSNEVETILRWKSPHYIAIYSENKENYKLNVGFMYQQVDLYLQTKGLGSCWIGLGRVKKTLSPLKFVILIAFGKAEKQNYRELDEFKRKEISEITDYPNEKLEVARLAPSATNNQPWFFKKIKHGYDIYCIKHRLIKSKIIGKWNHIDIGIAISHLYISNKDKFSYYFNKEHEELKGYYYIGSITI